MTQSPIVTVYLIGGPARCGKTTLTRRLQAQMSARVVELDLWKPAIINWTRAVGEHPILAAPSVSDHSPQEWVTQLRNRDLFVWEGLAQMLANSPNDGTIVEGPIWPDHVAATNFEREIKAVFLADLSPAFDQAKRLIKIARSAHTNNNWQGTWSDEKITAWAGYNRYRSSMYEEMAFVYGYPFFDVGATGLQDAQDAAFEFLTS